MATKKELIAELVALGAKEDEIKDLKNSELEELLEKIKEDSAPVGEPSEQKDESADNKEDSEDKGAEKKDEQAKGEVVRETSHQLSIFRDYIYNVQHKDAVVVVENLGYGDAYISTDGAAIVGKSDRLSFKEKREFKGIEKLYFASASQPVIQIVEVK